MGGGLTGVCAALELAERGCEVDLIEQSDEVISQASYWCEGKIHLGLVYAKDASGRTARTMIRGALLFRPLLQRWIDRGVLDSAVSGPFDYALHRDSMVPAAALERYFDRVAEIYEQESRKAAGCYIAEVDSRLWRRLGRSERKSTYDEELIVEAYRTQERAIDPQRIALSLRDAIKRSARLNVLAGRKVVAARIVGSAEVSVTVDHAGEQRTESYGAAVNALWQNRLMIDATAGLHAPMTVFHRYKVGLHSRGPIFVKGLPDVTFVTGAFGDSVSFGSRAYLSWYPAGNLFSDRSLAPPERPPALERLDRGLVIAETLGGLARLIMSKRDALLGAQQEWIVGGGYITAWGCTGIDDHGSQLHERYRIGVSSTGPFHSVDTGKYSMAPLFAHEACERILSTRAAL